MRALFRWMIVFPIGLLIGFTIMGAMMSIAGAADSIPSCITKLPSERTGYWAYRINRGKKCWYQARRGDRRYVVNRPARAVPETAPAPAPILIPMPTVTVIEIVSPEVYNSIDASLDKEEENTEFRKRFRGTESEDASR